MTEHTYPAAAMLGDYLRAAGGLVPAALILALSPFSAVTGTVLACFAMLFLVFGIRTALRHGTRIELSDSGLTASGPLGASILWSELDRMSLAYYSTHRDRRDGWMQLRLRAGGSSLRLDSRIEGFARLVDRAARAAELRCLPLSAATAANLEALGIRVPAASFGRSSPAGAV